MERTGPLERFRFKQVNAHARRHRNNAPAFRDFMFT